MKLFGASKIEGSDLYIGGIKATSLAEQYGTPLYVMDEQLLLDNCRGYINAFRAKEENNRVAFAGKAFLTVEMCKLIDREGLYLDVVSGGELYTAYKSDFPMEKIYFHGNNKTFDEIELGVKLGVGTFVVDNYTELEYLDKLAKKYDKIQNIYLRITPGIEAHTHEYIQTGQLDSKFGFALMDNNVIDVVRHTLEFENIKLVGLHSHIGSQIFDLKPFEDEVEIMLELMNNIYKNCGVRLEELDLGGGFGIYYAKGDNPKTTSEYCNAILNKADEVCHRLNYPMPVLSIEPGRSIVGNAGLTLYTVGAIKTVPGIRTYAAIDGGMGDNIRTALYEAEYECLVANRVEGENEDVTIAGKCCESGDIIIKNAYIPKLQTGDILAVLSTGAYGYSMASNYNRIPRPAMIMVENNNSRVVCKRESYEELIRNEYK